MRRFILTSPRIVGHVSLLYNSQQQLCQVCMQEATITAPQCRYLLQHVPVTVNDMELFVKAHKVTLVEADYEVSFDNFWSLYGKKINKARCLPLWAKLSKACQVKAWAGIKKYDAYLKANPWRTKADPETYLRNRMWDNEY
ncbi:MAG TPA: hypothetical protein PKD90_03495 [Phnomibacter sp.]|nr:hypothetical protein [Phnomibacter sp.]